MGRMFVGLIVLVASTSVVSASMVSFDDPLADDQWYLDHMNFEGAWGTLFQKAKRGRVRVAVIDSGFDLDHPELQRNIRRQVNIVNGSEDVRPVHPHGTGTIAPLAAE